MAERYNTRAPQFGWRRQLICMGFAQLTWRENLRDIEECRLWQDVTTGLINRARHLYAGEDLGLDLDETIYALDSTTIDLSLWLFPWAEFRSPKAGVKLRTQLDLRGPIRVQIGVRAARSHDVFWLDTLIFELGAFHLLVHHLPGLLNYLKHSITNAAPEGINSQTARIIANAHGVSYFEKLRTRVLFFLGKLDFSPA